MSKSTCIRCGDGTLIEQFCVEITDLKAKLQSRRRAGAMRVLLLACLTVVLALSTVGVVIKEHQLFIQERQRRIEVIKNFGRLHNAFCRLDAAHSETFRLLGRPDLALSESPGCVNGASTLKTGRTK